MPSSDSINPKNLIIGSKNLHFSNFNEKLCSNSLENNRHNIVIWFSKLSVATKKSSTYTDISSPMSFPNTLFTARMNALPAVLIPTGKL